MEHPFYPLQVHGEYTLKEHPENWIRYKYHCFKLLPNKTKDLIYTCYDYVSLVLGTSESTERYLEWFKESPIYKKYADRLQISLIRDSHTREKRLPLPLIVQIDVKLSQMSRTEFLMLMAPLRLFQDMPEQVMTILKLHEKYPKLSFLSAYCLSMLCQDKRYVAPFFNNHNGIMIESAAGECRRVGHSLFHSYAIQKIVKFDEDLYLKRVETQSTDNINHPLYEAFRSCSLVSYRTPTLSLFDVENVPLHTFYGAENV